MIETREMPVTAPPNQVRWAQQALNRALGVALTADGRVGPRTLGAIQEF